MTIDLRLKVSGFGARVEERAIEDGDVDIQADGAIPIGDMVVANGSFAYNAECADGGAPEVVFGAAEFLRGFDFVLQRSDFRALVQSLLDEREDIQRGSRDRGWLLDELKILLIRIAKNGGKCGE